MFVTNALAVGLARSIDRSIPVGHSMGEIADVLTTEVADIKKYVDQNLWLNILRGTLWLLIFQKAPLRTVHGVCHVLKEFDPREELPFQKIIDACWSEDYTELTFIINSNTSAEE